MLQIKIVKVLEPGNLETAVNAALQKLQPASNTVPQVTLLSGYIAYITYQIEQNVPVPAPPEGYKLYRCINNGEVLAPNGGYNLNPAPSLKLGGLYYGKPEKDARFMRITPAEASVPPCLNVQYLKTRFEEVSP